jgi:Spy/CpxP family protein refolding chaperone
MSLKNKFFSVLAIAIGVVGFSTFTLAQDQSTSTAPEKTERTVRGEGRGFGHKGGHNKFGMRHGRGMYMLHGLDLTEAQKTQIHSIMEANKPDQATMQEFRSLRQAKHDGTITVEQQERIKTLRAQSQDKFKAVHQQILAVLTPDQLAKLEQRKQERTQKWGDRKSRRQQDPAATTDQPADQ